MQDRQIGGWYLVFTKPRHENDAQLNLQQQGFHPYLPLLQEYERRRNLYKIVTKPLFPRYLFVYLRSGIDDWSKIRSTRGCVALVCFGPLPACVPTSLIEQLKQDEESRFIHSKTNIPDFKPGDRVRVLDGILSNYEGIVELKNSQQRITLLLSIAENYTCYTRRITLPVNHVEMIG